MRVYYPQTAHKLTERPLETLHLGSRPAVAEALQECESELRGALPSVTSPFTLTLRPLYADGDLVLLREMRRPKGRAPLMLVLERGPSPDEKGEGPPRSADAVAMSKQGAPPSLPQASPPSGNERGPTRANRDEWVPSLSSESGVSADSPPTEAPSPTRATVTIASLASRARGIAALWAEAEVQTVGSAPVTARTAPAVDLARLPSRAGAHWLIRGRLLLGDYPIPTSPSPSSSTSPRPSQPASYDRLRWLVSPCGVTCFVSLESEVPPQEKPSQENLEAARAAQTAVEAQVVKDWHAAEAAKAAEGWYAAWARLNREQDERACNPYARYKPFADARARRLALPGLRYLHTPLTAHSAPLDHRLDGSASLMRLLDDLLQHYEGDGASAGRVWRLGQGEVADWYAGDDDGDGDNAEEASTCAPPSPPAVVYVHGSGGRATLVGACLISLFSPSLPLSAVLLRVDEACGAPSDSGSRGSKGSSSSTSIMGTQSMSEQQRRFVKEFVAAVRCWERSPRSPPG